MSRKSVRVALADTLEDLAKRDYAKFCEQLLDRREEPRVRRSRVEGKNFLDVTDVLVSTFTEVGALQVAVEILRDIGCNGEAEALVEETREQSSKPGPGEDMHFVDKHKLDLIQRVGYLPPILDKLLAKAVIQQENYDKIRALSPPQEQIRELYRTGLKGGETCKDIFYKILQEEEPYLIDELRRNN